MLSFANDACWGTLSCVVLIHPETERKHREQFARVISELRYGGIAINAWAGVFFGLASPSWGAFPGHPPEDIRSGSGTVHNTFLFDHPQKTVLRAPFRMPVTPPWFADHKNVRELGATMVKFEAHPSWATFPPVALAGLRG